MEMTVEKLPVTGLWNSQIAAIDNLEALGLLLYLHSTEHKNAETLLKHFGITKKKYINLLNYLEDLSFLRIDEDNKKLYLVTNSRSEYE